jgi:predicted amidohydrolase
MLECGLLVVSVLNIALLQMAPHGTDQEANKRKGDEFCRRARKMGADIALFPEMWNIGYTAYASRVLRADYDPIQADADKAWRAQAIDEEDDFVVHFKQLARQLNMAIALTYLETWPGAPRNTLSLIDRQGRVVLTYAKVHTCDFSLEAACTPGEGFYVCDLDTEAGQVKVGAMICFDREFPESARILMLKGAEIILTPNACELEQHRLGQFRSRAYENMVGLAMANYAAPAGNGHSIAVDPMAFDEQERSRDTLIVEAGEREGVYLAEFDLAALRAYREREVWGNAYRKPGRYRLLTSPAVEYPFVRNDARR